MIILLILSLLRFGSALGGVEITPVDIWQTPLIQHSLNPLSPNISSLTWGTVFSLNVTIKWDRSTKGGGIETRMNGFERQFVLHKVHFVPAIEPGTPSIWGYRCPAALLPVTLAPRRKSALAKLLTRNSTDEYDPMAPTTYSLQIHTDLSYFRPPDYCFKFYEVWLKFSPQWGMGRHFAPVRNIIFRIHDPRTLAPALVEPDHQFQHAIEMKRHDAKEMRCSICHDRLATRPLTDDDAEEDVADFKDDVITDQERQEPIVRLSRCKHEFHKNCAETWLASPIVLNGASCPMCRERIEPKKITFKELREQGQRIFRANCRCCRYFQPHYR